MWRVFGVGIFSLVRGCGMEAYMLRDVSLCLPGKVYYICYILTLGKLTVILCTGDSGSIYAAMGCTGDVNLDTDLFPLTTRSEERREREL